MLHQVCIESTRLNIPRCQLNCIQPSIPRVGQPSGPSHLTPARHTDAQVVLVSLCFARNHRLYSRRARASTWTETSPSSDIARRVAEVVDVTLSGEMCGHLCGLMAICQRRQSSSSALTDDITKVIMRGGFPRPST